jgi:hypothetical protein
MPPHHPPASFTQHDATMCRIINILYITEHDAQHAPRACIMPPRSPPSHTPHPHLPPSPCQLHQLQPGRHADSALHHRGVHGALLGAGPAGQGAGRAARGPDDGPPGARCQLSDSLHARLLLHGWLHAPLLSITPVMCRCMWQRCGTGSSMSPDTPLPAYR